MRASNARTRRGGAGGGGGGDRVRIHDIAVSIRWRSRCERCKRDNVRYGLVPLSLSLSLSVSMSISIPRARENFFIGRVLHQYS